LKAYYNDNDPYCADWLRNLIAAGHLPAGDVDDRDIRDVEPVDVRDYRQCHFFAGIGGWAYALRLAGWSDARPVWTGSCPCQPFSVTGQRKGDGDKRHLWPEFGRLISECAPAIVFGEQVAGSDGREWLARVRADLEALGYAVGAADLCAASVGAPHIRQRLFWVADTSGGQFSQSIGKAQKRDGYGPIGANHTAALSTNENYWRGAERLLCRDKKWRPIESGTFPLAHGVSARLAKLRAFGNAIVPQVAAEIIRAMR
jgi:DNA (cytosine-5)-methyltransferase 1